MTDRKIHILLLVDNTEDVERLKSQLKKLDMEFDCRIIQQKEELTGILEESFPSEEGLSVFFRDITEEKLAEQKIREVNEKLETAQQIAKLGYWEVNLQTEETYWSDQSYAIWEYDPQEDNITLEKIMDRMHPDDRKRFLEANDRTLEQHVPLDLKHRILLPDGTLKWIHVIGNIRKSADGEPRYLEGTAQDITELKKAEQQLKRLNEKLETAQQIAKLGYWEVNLQTGETYWSDQSYAIWEYDPQEDKITLEKIMDRMHPDDRKRFLEANDRTLEQHVPLDLKHRILLSDGTVKWIHVIGNIRKSADGEPRYLEGTAQDITELKKAEQQLKRLNEKLEQRAEELAASNAELEQFAYVASHDLQEPLRMVTSFLTQLNKKYDDQLDEKAQQYIHFAVDGARRMRQVILDLLNYSRIGQMDEEVQEVHLKRILNEVLKMEQSTIEELEADIQRDKLPVIRAAETPMLQLFQNLVSNALKYHKPGVPPVIRIDCEETETHWQISVSDNGIGIDPVYSDSIFKIFNRLHTRKEYPGTGIGLALCKKIVEQYEGTIWVESEEEKGSTFYFTLSK